MLNTLNLFLITWLLFILKLVSFVSQLLSNTGLMLRITTYIWYIIICEIRSSKQQERLETETKPKTYKTDWNKNLLTQKAMHNLEPLTYSCQGLYEITFGNFSISLLPPTEWEGNEKLPAHYCSGTYNLTKQMHDTTHTSDMLALLWIKTWF
jgi:hypothetical protein